MSAKCCGPAQDIKRTRAWVRVLWIALALNAAMFAVELTAGALSGSRALQADALDFLGDAANYAISLGVVGLALVWRARAAIVKGATIIVFGFYVLGAAIWAAVYGSSPDPEVMGVIGLLALMVNVGVALMLYRFRDGDANMRSVWICSRNDAIGNIAVMLAALGVFGTGTAWPDLIVAALMAALALSGGITILCQARNEITLSNDTQVRAA
ncbi:MAG: cation transporter [Hyphomicrobiaceae bacterium]